MKRAGAKNDGAWFRSNKVITRLNGAERVMLAAKIVDENDYVDAAFNDMLSLAAEAGNLENIQADVPDAQTWITTMIARGIPRQVWNGHLSFTTYTKQPVPGEDRSEYIPNYQDNLRRFAVQLRKSVRNFIFGRRATNDIFDMSYENDGNVLPDANLDQ